MPLIASRSVSAVANGSHRLSADGHNDPSEVDAVVIETEGSLSAIKTKSASLEALEKVGVDVNRDIGDRGVLIGGESQ